MAIEVPPLWDFGKRTFLSTLAFALKQGTLEPVYTAIDKLKFLGYTKKEKINNFKCPSHFINPEKINFFRE